MQKDWIVMESDGREMGEKWLSAWIVLESDGREKLIRDGWGHEEWHVNLTLFRYVLVCKNIIWFHNIKPITETAHYVLWLAVKIGSRSLWTPFILVHCKIQQLSTTCSLFNLLWSTPNVPFLLKGCVIFSWILRSPLTSKSKQTQ